MFEIVEHIAAVIAAKEFEIRLPPLDELLHDPRRRLLLVVAAGAIALIVLVVVTRIIRGFFKTQPQATRLDAALVIELASLDVPNDAASLRLTVYNVPVRLGVVVIAPLGRDADAPSAFDAPSLLNGVVPGLGELLARDRAVVRVWPRQFSAAGFAHSVARHIRLPCDHGRATPWCLATGRASADGGSVGIGLALAAVAPNKLSVIAIESDQQWLDVLRVARPA